MLAYMQWVAAYYGFGTLDLTLGDDSRRRLVRACALPAFVVVAELITLSLTFALDQPFYTESPEFWERLLIASSVAASALLPVALAVLFIEGVRPWGRPEGSWMFVAGMLLALVAFGLGLTSVLMYMLFGYQDATADLKADRWASIAKTGGFLAVGFIFVAFRALHSAEAPAYETEAAFEEPPEELPGQPEA